MERTYKIKNIDCENCARKLEKYILEKFDLEQVTINMMSEKIIIKGKKVKPEDIERVANEIESGIVVTSLDAEENHEDNDEHEQHKELVKLLLSGAFFALGIAYQYDVLFILSYVIIGYRVVWMALKNISKLQFFDEFFLMSLATIAALAINELPEAAAVMLFYSVGEYIQERSLAKTKASITTLEALRVKEVSKVVNGEVVKVKPSALVIEDEIIVEAGEKVGVDCTLLEERASFNTAHITGESKPVQKKNGQEVLAGSIAESSAVHLKVLREENNSTIAKLIELITYADSRKTKTELFITRFSKIYTPIVCLIALLLVIFLPPIFGMPLEDAVYRAVTLLVISCPCALVLSVPLGYVAAIGRLAQEKILVKGSNAIDRLTKLTLIATDKTGTLTTGKFSVSKFENLSSMPDAKIHEMMYAGERWQTHPIAKSIVEYTKQFGSDDSIKSEVVPGVGIRFNYNNDVVEVKKFDEENLTDSISAVYVNGALSAKYYLSDTVKESSYVLVNSLREMGIKLSMLTGDNNASASKVADSLGLDKAQVHANLMPDDKLTIVENELNKGEVVGFVGDGINDAAVIKRSDIGISMGVGGSALAIENSDIVISNDEIGGIIEAITVSKKATKIIKQNIVLAIIVKILFIVLGVFGYTTMWEAVFSDVGVTLIAIANSLRIRR